MICLVCADQFSRHIHWNWCNSFFFCVTNLHNSSLYFNSLLRLQILIVKHKAWTLIVGICSLKIQWKTNWRDLTSVKAKFIRRVYAETISLEVHIFCEECHTVNVITRKPICNIYRINLTLSLFTEAIIMMILTFFEMVVFFVVWKT